MFELVHLLRQSFLKLHLKETFYCTMKGALNPLHGHCHIVNALENAEKEMVVSGCVTHLSSIILKKGECRIPCVSLIGKVFYMEYSRMLCFRHLHLRMLG
ncbi:hypothetical protein KC19_3G125000 [Ceratodon purpureus]|uniref:Uncharacterized protein n=1 Tax=Ceratodon purpureus TaxID=3225 RepID=A0A8T0IK78_CERPU|nr:hypothetical protein KC19_3G125000 [Ceratodon purpureus]